MGQWKKEFIDPWRADAPEPKHFTDVYTESEIIADIKETARRKASIQKESHDRALLTEALIYFLVDKRKLLGRGVEAFPASHYDDLVNGVDMVLEITRGETPCLLGIDVTVSEDPRVLSEKKGVINKDLRDEKLTEVKYFQSEPHPKGRVEIPKVVLNITRKELRNIADMLHSRRDNDAILRPLQEKLTNQIGTQLTQAEYILENLRPLTGRRRMLISIYQKLRQSISLNS